MKYNKRKPASQRKIMSSLKRLISEGSFPSDFRSFSSDFMKELIGDCSAHVGRSFGD